MKISFAQALVLLWILLLGFSAKVQADPSTTPELLFAKGVERYNDKFFDEAIPYFQKVLDQEPRFFLAMEYLSFIAEKKSNYPIAIEWLMRAKTAAPLSRSSLLDFHLARLYLFERNIPKAKAFLEAALHEGEFLAEAPYLLGYLHYIEGEYLPALPYFEKARDSVSKGKTESDFQLAQAVHTYLGEIYARYGFERYAISEFWKAERGDSVVLRTSAWSMHSEVNEPSWSAYLSEQGMHDSNAAVLSFADQTPIKKGESPGAGHAFTVGGGYRSAPGQPWVWGVLGEFKFVQFFSSALEGTGTLQLKLKPWIDFWTRRDWVLRASYDVAHQQFNPLSPTALQTLQGPGLELQYFPYRRWIWSVGARHSLNQFYADTGRQGQVTELNLGVKLSNPVSKFRPQLLYRFQLHISPSPDARAYMHYGLLHLDYQLFRRFMVSGEAGLIKRAFPDHAGGRSDTGTLFSATLRWFLGNHWILALSGERYRNDSTFAPQGYSHLLGTAGLTYTF